jgi:hypothetical protein
VREVPRLDPAENKTTSVHDRSLLAARMIGSIGHDRRRGHLHTDAIRQTQSGKSLESCRRFVNHTLLKNAKIVNHESHESHESEENKIQDSENGKRKTENGKRTAAAWFVVEPKNSGSERTLTHCDDDSVTTILISSVLEFSGS